MIKMPLGFAQKDEPGSSLLHDTSAQAPTSCSLSDAAGLACAKKSAASRRKASGLLPGAIPITGGTLAGDRVPSRALAGMAKAAARPISGNLLLMLRSRQFTAN